MGIDGEQDSTSHRGTSLILGRDLTQRQASPLQVVVRVPLPDSLLESRLRTADRLLEGLPKPVQPHRGPGDQACAGARH
ncbi:MAG: hypothetical protein CMJ68_12240 [Planctomycetaceae bacterium]|nr:hypothetical protein [Planctomycetaceae bacterium]